MTKRQAERATQAQITRAITAAQKAGLPVYGVDAARGVVLTYRPDRDEAPETGELDPWGADEGGLSGPA